MAKFNPRRIHFGENADTDDNGDDLPTPVKIRLQARRLLGIREAATVLQAIPSPGESLHVLCTDRMDLTDVITALLERLGKCERVLIATLGYNTRNLKAILDWLDNGRIDRLTLLASIFFRSHNGDLWTETLEELHERGQRAACCHSHAKVITLAFADGSRYSIEGSANLCGNGSGREQFALINHHGLHDWHSDWITATVAKHEGRESDH